MKVTKIVEVVGIAGTGKSTLCDKIVESFPQCDSSFRLPRISTFHWQFLGFLVFLIPIYKCSKKGFFVFNLKLAVHMFSTVRYLQRNKKKLTDVAIIFDQGVFFEYASICNIGVSRDKKHLCLFLESLLIDYVKLLDGVVFLNAESQILIDRVLKRESDHRLKHLQNESVHDFFNGYSEVYKYISDIVSKTGSKTIDIDTSYLTPSSVFDSFKDFFHQDVGLKNV